jgi:AhpD family alkylhydroperoxidase
METLQSLSTLAEKSGLPKSLVELVHLRASQINGCSVCVDMHARNLIRTDESTERSFAVAAWRDAPYFTDAERAALALTETVTRMSDRADPVADEIWDEAARHFDQKSLAGLLLAISTRQVAGEWMKSAEARKWVEEHAGAAAR